MKRLLLSLVACLVCCAVAVADGTGAVAAFKTRIHDFGTIKEDGGPVSYTFEFENSGDKPLIIVEATASCGCTKPEYTTKPVKPGNKGKIKVTYSPIGRPGAFRKTIKVKTNSSTPRTTLIIEGTVIPKKK